jgi:imidazoleglycerol-phosphate dehydratase
MNSERAIEKLVQVTVEVTPPMCDHWRLTIHFFRGGRTLHAPLPSFLRRAAMARTSRIERKTAETKIRIELNLDGQGMGDINTGIAFFDHMLTLFCVHGGFDLEILADGDLAVDFHHTVEDVALVLGEAVSTALDNRAGIRRYGFAVTPMDDALAEVAIDLSNRPFLVYHLPAVLESPGRFDRGLAKEFFRAFAVKGGMNLHINVKYGENEHHVLESIYKSVGRALKQAVFLEPDRSGVRSSKGVL